LTNVLDAPALLWKAKSRMLKGLRLARTITSIGMRDWAHVGQPL
jgi:hypothetical protein